MSAPVDLITIENVTKKFNGKVVLDNFSTVKVATAYQYNDKETQELPFDACTKTMEPIYAELPGWQQKIDGNIPRNLVKYIKFIEEYVKRPITYVSYGPDRNELVKRPEKI